MPKPEPYLPERRTVREDEKSRASKVMPGVHRSSYTAETDHRHDGFRVVTVVEKFVADDADAERRLLDRLAEPSWRARKDDEPNRSDRAQETIDATRTATDDVVRRLDASARKLAEVRRVVNGE